MDWDAYLRGARLGPGAPLGATVPRALTPPAPPSPRLGRGGAAPRGSGGRRGSARGVALEILLRVETTRRLRGPPAGSAHRPGRARPAGPRPRHRARPGHPPLAAAARLDARARVAASARRPRALGPRAPPAHGLSARRSSTGSRRGPRSTRPWSSPSGGDPPGAAAFVNGVLRALASEPRPWPVPTAADPVEALALRASHPTWLVERWWARYGPAEAEALALAMNAAPPVVVRANTLRLPVGRRGRRPSAAGVGAAATRFAPEGLSLERAGDLRQLGRLRDGSAAVQDEAAILVGHALGPASRGDGRRRVRGAGDEDHAPGGAHGEPGPDRRRGPPRGAARPRSGRRARGSAPPSSSRAWPTRGRSPGPSGRRATASWSTRPARTSASSGATPTASGAGGPATSRRSPPPRRAILEAAAELVRPGGVLVYATCSLEPEENEAVVAGLRARRPDFVPDPLPPAVPAACRVAPDILRMTPHRHGSDGFTAHRLRRRA